MTDSGRRSSQLNLGPLAASAPNSTVPLYLPTRLCSLFGPRHAAIIIHNLCSSGSQFPPPIPMSASNQTVGPSTSIDNFSTIFNAASTEYHRVTGKCLDTHPFAAQLDACDSPKAVSDLLRTQAQAFNKFRKGDDKLMACLDPTVHILFTFSATLGEGIGLVSCWLDSCGMTVL